MLKFSKMKAAMATIVLAALGFSTVAQAVSNTPPPGGVPIESSLAVSNATSGDGKYHDSISAKVDDVVKVEVWYHNPEPDNSGKVAKGVNVRVAIPATKAKAHQVTSSVGGSNTNTETGLVTVNSSIDTTLEYIPGTAYRRHNIGTNANPNIVTEKISDSVVTTGFVVPEVQPCWNFQETITVQARVKAPTLSITKQVKVEGEKEWRFENEAKPGQTLSYIINFKNEGNTKLNNVIIRDSMPPKLEFVKGSAKLFNANYPNGFQLSDQLIDSGVNIGNYEVGANAFVRFQAKVPKDIGSESCLTLKNVGVAKAENLGEYYNIAVTKVCFKVTPAVTPTPTPTPGVTPTPVPTKPTSLPVTGPVEAAGLLLGSLGLWGGNNLYQRSKKLLADSLKKS